MSLAKILLLTEKEYSRFTGREVVGFLITWWLGVLESCPGKDGIPKSNHRVVQHPNNQ